MLLPQEEEEDSLKTTSQSHDKETSSNSQHREKSSNSHSSRSSSSHRKAKVFSDSSSHNHDSHGNGSHGHSNHSHKQHEAGQYKRKHRRNRSDDHAQPEGSSALRPGVISPPLPKSTSKESEVSTHSCSTSF